MQARAPGKSRDNLQATVLRKRGRMLKEIVHIVGGGGSASPTGGCSGWSAKV